jgi:uncharacterized membrane protein
MAHSSSYRTLRVVAAFFTAAGCVLAVLVAGIVLREIIAPPDHTWSPWTRGAIIATSLVAIGFCLAGGVLSYRLHCAHREAVRTFLSGADRDRITAAIRDAESKTSGEIVVHVAERTHHMPTIDARKAFEKIGMTRTRERNGVLFFVAVRDHKLAVIGDKGIHERVPADYWADIVKTVEAHFVEGRFGDGLAEGIARVGTELSRHFPRRADDVNELPDS